MTKRFWFLLFALWTCREATAAPGVPALPDVPKDYVGYAVDNLPAHYKAAIVANRNNTPASNPITNAGATLGRVLFYDKRLSHNDAASCASCHRQEDDFADPNQFSSGFDGQLTARHSPALSNNAYYQRGRYFWDERAPTLEDLALMPIQDPIELGSNLDQVRSELAATKFYPQLFEQAFGTPEITDERIAMALAQFVRSMVSYQSKFDRAATLGSATAPNFAAAGYTDQEVLGAQIFQGGSASGACNGCHATNAHVATIPSNNGLDLTSLPTDGAGNGRFKTPSLRNVAVRDKFMHDGRFASLEEVIEFYSSGVQANPFLGRGMRAGGFQFTPEQIDALVAFLGTLTDEAFLTSDLFSNPFVDLPGDFDGNGEVDDADLVVWQGAYGVDALGDADADGDSDGRDFLIWQRNLGLTWQNFSPLAAVTSVPEPATGLLGGILVIPWILRRRR